MKIIGCLWILCLWRAAAEQILQDDQLVNKADCNLEPAGVYVAISSEAEETENVTIRWMKVHWWGMTTQMADDWVGLWDHDPSGSLNSYLESAIAVGVDGGVQFTTEWDDDLYPSDFDSITDCLPFWGGYVQNGTLLFSSCLRLYWNWMEMNQQDILHMTLSQVALPGTHDAGAFGKYGDGFIGTTATKWVFTQDEDFWQQLMLGVRYFDMRIGYYENTTEKYFVTHDIAIIRPLMPYLEDVFYFMNNTKEIIIFDIHSFTHGFDDDLEVIQNFTSFMEDYFGDLLVPNYLEPNPTMEDIWASGGRMILTYPNITLSDYIWKRVNHVWGDVNQLDHLYIYMDTCIPVYYNLSYWDNATYWSAMTEFTPTTLDWISNSWGGLRGAAAITNEPVNLWLRREWWTMINIISMDFIASSDIIHTVIETNQKRSTCDYQEFHPLPMNISFCA